MLGQAPGRRQLENHRTVTTDRGAQLTEAAPRRPAPSPAAHAIGPTPLWCCLDRRTAAALVGIAPFARDSGLLKGADDLGGRHRVRAVLYMATLVAIRHNPTRRVFYDRLVAAGKAKKLALTAAVSKLLVILNAMLRDGQPMARTTISLTFQDGS